MHPAKAVFFFKYFSCFAMQAIKAENTVKIELKDLEITKSKTSQLVLVPQLHLNSEQDGEKGFILMKKVEVENQRSDDELPIRKTKKRTPCFSGRESFKICITLTEILASENTRLYTVPFFGTSLPLRIDHKLVAQSTSQFQFF